MIEVFGKKSDNSGRIGNLGINESWEGIAFSIMGLLPSIASTLAYSLPAGPAGLVWVGKIRIFECGRYTDGQRDGLSRVASSSSLVLLWLIW